MIRFMLISFTLFLGSCTSDPEWSTLDAATSYFAPREYVPSARFTALFREPRPVLDIEFVDLGVAGKLILEQEDGDYARYLSADLGGIVLQNGMIHSIYGFGEPLVGAELSQSLALVLSGQPGQADRFSTYLDDEDRPVRRTYRCEIGVQGMRNIDLVTGAVETLLMSETCQNLSTSVENLFWVDLKRREIVQSRQWISDRMGSIVTRLRRL
ncbi:YjbF family lipoprotein (plasmid) [Rhodobacteraceae bacterium S2214]|nr:YjbF family lipoprotein [Rhodobacteraceae bacterium S2214]